MPSSDIPLRRDHREEPPEPASPVDPERELAMDLAVLIAGGLIVEIDHGDSVRYAVAAPDGQA